MKCSECATENPENAEFCQECGSKLENYSKEISHTEPELQNKIIKESTDDNDQIFKSRDILSVIIGSTIGFIIYFIMLYVLNITGNGLFIVIIFIFIFVGFLTTILSRLSKYMIIVGASPGVILGIGFGIIGTNKLISFGVNLDVPVFLIAMIVVCLIFAIIGGILSGIGSMIVVAFKGDQIKEISD